MKRRCMNPLLATGDRGFGRASEEMVVVFSLVQVSRAGARKRGETGDVRPSVVVGVKQWWHSHQLCSEPCPSILETKFVVRFQIQMRRSWTTFLAMLSMPSKTIQRRTSWALFAN